MIKTKAWIMLFVCIFIICVGFMSRSDEGDGAVVWIYRDGTCIYSVDLEQVTEPYDLPLADAGGTNTIRIEPGRVRMAAADCPDQICVRMGWSSGQTIVCLPHRVVLRFKENTFDGAMR